MSNDNSNNGPPNDRRGSVTSAALSNLFHRSNSTSTGNPNARDSITAAAARDQRRRLSVTTLGLSGTTPSSATTPFGGYRRGSISTNNSDSIDENAVEDDESIKAAPTSPFARRMSFGAQAMRSMRSAGPTTPASNDNGYNWSEQLRSRAESSVAGQRPSFGARASISPNRPAPQHDRAKSVSDMPAPPKQAATMKPKQPKQNKPDHMQERILKGDFYMD